MFLGPPPAHPTPFSSLPIPCLWKAKRKRIRIGELTGFYVEGVTKALRGSRLEEKPKPRDCPELRMPGEGESVATELFYMRIGTLRYSRRWIDPDAVLRGQIFLTALSASVLLLAGFALGWVAATATAAAAAAESPPPTVAFGSGAVFEYGSSGRLPVAVAGSAWLDGVADEGSGCACDCAQARTGITELASRSRANLSSVF